MNHVHRSALVVVVLFCMIQAPSLAGAAEITEFYKGRTIRLVIGAPPGGGFDTYTRAIARNITKHVPGEPRIIVQNMPGASFAISMNYLYNIAKRDGSIIAGTNSGLVMKQIVGVKGFRFDMRKFGWLGSAGKATPTCMVMTRTGVSDLKGLMNAPKPVNFGSAGTLTREAPLILRDFVGAKINLVEGYHGTSQIRAAIHRGEVDGYCSSWESVRVRAKSLLRGKDGDKLVPVITSGDKNEPVLKNLPEFGSNISNEDDRAAFGAWLAPYRFFRAYITPPGLPEDRLKALQTAFKETLDDPTFQEVSGKIGIEISYLSGTEVEGLLKQIFSLPPEAKARLQKLILGK